VAKGKRDNSYLHKAIRKYGVDTFEVTVIHTVAQDYVSLCEWEKFYIEALKLAGPLYNLTDGGEGTSGRKQSAKTHEAVSKNMKRLLQKMTTDLVWKAAHHERLKKRWEDPVWKLAHSERMKKMNADPEFKEAHSERMKKMLHIRWHVNRNMVNLNCSLCIERQSWQLLPLMESPQQTL